MRSQIVMAGRSDYVLCCMEGSVKKTETVTAIKNGRGLPRPCSSYKGRRGINLPTPAVFESAILSCSP